MDGVCAVKSLLILTVCSSFPFADSHPTRKGKDRQKIHLSLLNYIGYDVARENPKKSFLSRKLMSNFVLIGNDRDPFLFGQIHNGSRSKSQ